MNSKFDLFEAACFIIVRSLQKILQKPQMSLMIFYLFFLLVGGRAFFSNFQTPFPRISKIKQKTAEEVEIGTEYFYRIGLPLKFKTASFHIAASQKVTEK